MDIVYTADYRIFLKDWHDMDSKTKIGHWVLWSHTSPIKNKIKNIYFLSNSLNLLFFTLSLRNTIMNIQKHQSKIAEQHLLFAKCVAIVKSSGEYGIKKGALFLKAGVPMSQFYNMHILLRDFDDIEWIKSRGIYRAD